MHFLSLDSGTFGLEETFQFIHLFTNAVVEKQGFLGDVTGTAYSDDLLIGGVNVHLRKQVALGLLSQLESGVVGNAIDTKELYQFLFLKGMVAFAKAAFGC